MTTIVGVHGISKQQLGRRQLLKLWLPALGDGLERATGRQPSELPDMDLVFYGDLFLPLDPGTAIAPDDGPSLKGDGPAPGPFDGIDDEELADLVEAASELVSEQEITDNATTPTKAYLRVPIPLQALFGAIGGKFGFAAAVLVFGDLRQVRRYLREPEVKAEVDRRMAAAMSPDCRILVAHSLGSVVALEYVRQHPERELPLLLTLGSPLGLKMVRRRLPELRERPSTKALREPPPQVRQWTNVYDRRDPVACTAPLGKWWRAVTDVLVDNGSDTHDATNYLGKRATGTAIAAALDGRT